MIFFRSQENFMRNCAILSHLASLFSWLKKAVEHLGKEHECFEQSACAFYCDYIHGRLYCQHAKQSEQWGNIFCPGCRSRLRPEITFLPHFNRRAWVTGECAARGTIAPVISLTSCPRAAQRATCALASKQPRAPDVDVFPGDHCSRALARSVQRER